MFILLSSFYARVGGRRPGSWSWVSPCWASWPILGLAFPINKWEGQGNWTCHQTSFDNLLILNPYVSLLKLAGKLDKNHFKKILAGWSHRSPSLHLNGEPRQGEAPGSFWLEPLPTGEEPEKIRRRLGSGHGDRWAVWAQFKLLWGPWWYQLSPLAFLTSSCYHSILPSSFFFLIFYCF